MSARRPAGRSPLVLAAALALVALAGAGPATAAQVRYVAKLGPPVIGLDDLVTFTIQATSDGFGGVRFEPHFELENLELVGGPIQQQSSNWVNGVTSSSVVLTWRLRPRAVGKARVRAIQADAGGTATPLPDQEIEVQKESPETAAADEAESPDPFQELFGGPLAERRAPRRAAQPKVFLRAEIEPQRAVVGQQVLYRLWLYTQTDVSSFNPSELPTFKGFWVREIPQPSRLKPEWVVENGERIGRVAMIQRALYPLAPGDYTLEPARAELVVRVVDSLGFGPGFVTPEPRRLATNAVELKVTPVPDPPPDFSGLVGGLGIEATLDRKEVDVGQAATLRLKLSGPGHLQRLAPPTLALPPGLRVFAPAESSDAGGGALSASREFRFVIVPERPGEYRIPPIELSYYDPKSAAFRKATGPALAVVAHGVAAALPEATAAATPAAGRDERVETGAWRLAAAAGGGALLTLFAFVTWQRLRRPGAAAKTPDALRILRERVAAAEGAGSPREAAGGLEDAWRDYLTARWRLPGALPPGEWRPRLTAAGAEEGLADSLVALIDDLHYLRFAPQLADSDSVLAEAVERSRQLLRALR